MVLHASLYSALLSTVTLKFVQNCCQNHTHRNWLPRSPLQLLDAASCSHGDNLRNTCLGHPVLQKVGNSAGRLWSRRSWEEAPKAHTSCWLSAHSTSASEQKEHSWLILCNLLLFLDRKSRGIPNRSMEKKTNLFVLEPRINISRTMLNRKKIRAPEVPNSSPDTGNSQCRFFPLCHCSPACATSLPLGTSWSPSFLPTLSVSKGHIPEARITSLQPAPCYGTLHPSCHGERASSHTFCWAVFSWQITQKNQFVPLLSSFSSSGILPSVTGDLQLFVSLWFSLLAGVSRLCRLFNSLVRLTVGCLCFGIGRDPALQWLLSFPGIGSFLLLVLC